MKLIIEKSYRNHRCYVYLSEKQGSRQVFIHFDGSNLVEQVLPDNPSADMDIKPFFSVPMDMLDDLIKAFITEGAKQNLRTENENLLKGKLEATELHLSDMREFSKKLLDSKITSPNP
jgi:hypothetical protein